MSALTPLLDADVLFVGGKGGVGKTTVAAAIALRAADLGRRALLVSTDPAHSLGDLFGCPIGDRVTRLAGNLDALEIDADTAADAHIESVRQSVRGLVRGDLAAEADRQIGLARHAPGAVEAALIERLADIVLDDGRARDLIVFDTAPIGHTLRLLELPEIMAAWTDGMLGHQRRAEGLERALDHVGTAALGTPGETRPGGGRDRLARIGELLAQRRRKLERMRRLIRDPARTAFALVTTPERLPIAETAKARRLLEDQGIAVAALIVNRVLPDTADGTFVATRRERERGYLAEIARMAAGLPSRRVPLLGRDVAGLDALRDIAACLFEPQPG